MDDIPHGMERKEPQHICSIYESWGNVTGRTRSILGVRDSVAVVKEELHRNGSDIEARHKINQ
jgi:hypothetical protein